MLIKGLIDIDEFRILKPFGSGGFVNTCTIKNKNDEKFFAKIAVREDNPDYANENDFMYREISFFSRIKHPCFTKYIGYSSIDFDHQPKPVLITEFCEKGTLRTILNLVRISLAEFEWNDTVILKIIYGISKAMSFLHSNDIIHRNLKPEVIVLDKDYNPKISDLSLAEKFDSQKCETVGTPIYMAPEIWENGECTKKSDVFAFSMIVYELVGTKPFEDIKSIYEIENKIRNKIRPSFDNLIVNETYQELITRCWSQDPNERPSFDEITQLLKKDPGFILDSVDKEEFLDYVETIDNADTQFEVEKEVIPISEDNINQPIPKELKQQFYENPQKIKYFMILESKQEINLLSCHFSYNQNFNITIDLEKLKTIISKKYLSLIETSKNSKNVQENIEDIKKTIDEEYNKLYDQIKTKSICSTSLAVLNKVIEILEKSISIKIEDSSEIQKQIDQVLDDYPSELLFNKDKLREIPFSSTPISEMLLSLNAIKQNPKFRNPLLNELPKVSILYSPSTTIPSYAKSLANILSGNCFFITLYGNQSCTHQVLSSLYDNNIEKHQENDLITIYGPVDFVSFGKTVTLSYDMLKRFNGNYPNLYFLEVSNKFDNQDNLMKKWCEFISYISHYIVFCSSTTPTQKDINDFKNSLLLNNFRGSLISCSPYSKEPINFDALNYDIQMNINIDYLLDGMLLNYLFAEIFKIRFNFIPSETASTLSFLVIEKKAKINIKNEKIKQDIMQNYSNQIHNKAIQYFHDQVHKIIDQIYSNIESGKYFDNLHINKIMESLMDKTLEFFYTNIYVEFWQDKEIELVSKVLISEIKNDFESSFVPIKYIETIGKLLTLLESGNLKSIKNQIPSILENLRGFNSFFNIEKIPKSREEIQSYVLKVKQIFDDFVSQCKENQNLLKTVNTFSNKLYSFLDENPVVSDKEYSLHYNELYELNTLSKNSNFEKYIDTTLNIRKVLDEYKPKKYTVDINQKSFKQGGINLESNSMEFVLKSTMTCHELYDYIKKSFKLENVPFYVNRLSNDQFNNIIDIVVLDDQTNLMSLNSFYFTVHYGVSVYSTQVLIESLIPQKTIKIAEDFIIKTNSINSSYTVKFPSDHKGWFGVEWDINDNSKIKKDTDYALVYLTLTAEEISFLQEGNLLYHQSYHDGQWIDEYDPIFLSGPDCQTAVFPLRHCSPHRIKAFFIRIARSGFVRRSSSSLEKYKELTKKIEMSGKKAEPSTKKATSSKKVEPSSKKEETATKKVDSSLKKVEPSSKKEEPAKEEEEENQINLAELLNNDYSRDWEHENGDIKYSRGGAPYYLPVGYKSEGIKVEKFKENTCVGFHGTEATKLFKIIQEGFKLPSELHGVRDGHIKLGVTLFDIKNFPDAIFVSPSIRYSEYYGNNYNKIVAKSKECTYIHVGHIEKNQVLLIILQTRVTPKSYTVHANTTNYDFFDPHYDDDHLEWRIKNKENIFPYRILYKTMSIRDYSSLFVRKK